MTNEKIAVFDRNFRCGLDDIVEAVGHTVSKEQIAHIPEDFPNGCLNGYSTLIFVGPAKIDAMAHTVRIPFNDIEDEARKSGVKTIYRLARFSPEEEGVRQGTNYGIKKIDL